MAFTDTLHFAPIALGTVSATLLVASNSPSSPDTIKVSGFGFGIPALQFSTKTISLGNVKVGSFKDTTVTITNAGNDTLKITSIVSSHSTFTARPTVKNIPPGQSLTDTLRFAPITVGADSALIVIQSNSGSSPDTIKVAGIAIPTTSVENISEIPTEYALSQNYPNPFNPSTNIAFSIPTKSFVLLKVFDLVGREVATLIHQEKPVGTYHVTFDAGKLPSGIYLYRLTAGDFTQVKKMLLVK
jgi:hypothetical protein